MVIPTIGSLVTGFLLVRYFPNARGSGIPQTKYALFINNGYISLRTVIGKFVCCATSLASGRRRCAVIQELISLLTE